MSQISSTFGIHLAAGGSDHHFGAMPALAAQFAYVTNASAALGRKPMHMIRRFATVAVIFSFVLIVSPTIAQQVIATIPAGQNPYAVAVNPQTNKIYVANNASNNVTVIDGATLQTATVAAGVNPISIAVNAATNKIYVANNTSSNVTVIDGATLQTTNVAVGQTSYRIAVNPQTNRIYVTNFGSNNVTVIDGATLQTTNLDAGPSPFDIGVNSATNQIYVASYPYHTLGTVTVIDGATNQTVGTVSRGAGAPTIAINPLTNKVYVANYCGDDPGCTSHTGTVTAVDGTSLQTTIIPVGGYPDAVALNSITSQIYIGNNSDATATVIDGATNHTTTVAVGANPYAIGVNETTNKIYVANKSGSVTMIDWATNHTTTVRGGSSPWSIAVNPMTNRIYVANYGDNTVSVIAGANATPFQFVPVTPCRVVDTRPENGGSGPIRGGSAKSFSPPLLGGCNIPATATAYALNVTVAPVTQLGFLTLWPTGAALPGVSTLNSLDGRIKANAAIVPAGADGSISVFATDTTNVIVDISGYFAPVSNSTLAFYPLAPCRVADTRFANDVGLGSPYLTGGVERSFPILNGTACNIPSSAEAYSLNVTAVPRGPLGYLTVWPSGEARPWVSTLNNFTGTIVANAAIVPAGSDGNVSAYASSDTDLVIDINGYFARAVQGGLSFYPMQPCRVSDTRNLGNELPFSGTLNPPVDVVHSPCPLPENAQAYGFNTTVVPQGSLGYLSLWPEGEPWPLVSTLNALDGYITNNMAIVPTNNGLVDAYASSLTHLILDICSYFAP